MQSISRRNDPLRIGVIVNVSSVQAMMSVERVAAYATSKAAMLGLTRSIAVDYAPYNVRSSAVCPGSGDLPASAIEKVTQGGKCISILTYNAVCKP